MRNSMMIAATMFLAVGCGGEPVDTEQDTVDQVAKDDSSYPSGVFENAHPQLGDFNILELNGDHTFLHKTQGVDCLPNFGTCGQVTGTYKFSHTTTTRYLRFYDETGSYMDRYAYKLSGSTLSLRATGGHWFNMTRSTTLSGKDESCGGFTTQPKQCADGLVCIYGGVPDVPGKCQPANPCQEAGGECVALAPGACKGQVQDARAFSCGGGLGVECCFAN
jgi:hypothetical protein